MGLPLDFNLVPDFSRFWGLLFRLLSRFMSPSMTKAFELEMDPLSFWRASSFSKLDFTYSRDRCFPCGPALPNVTTSISQLSGRDPSNSNVNSSLARGTFRAVVWFISPWKALSSSSSTDGGRVTNSYTLTLSLTQLQRQQLSLTILQ